MAVLNPTKWSDEELKKNRDLSEGRFILERRGEGPTAFYAAIDEVAPKVEEAMVATDNLRQLNGDVLAENQTLWQTLRYFCAPPVSEEDLWTLVGHKFKNMRSDIAPTTAEALAAVLDNRRFPWVELDRAPTDIERANAIAATTTLLAHETLKTTRRGISSKAQEDDVSDALVAAGLKLDPSRSVIETLDQLERGSFSRERKVSGAKCDIPIRLRDGRLLALECKVSNGPKNGWKRLSREVGGKSQTWTDVFGKQVLTAALIAGVFDFSCVQKTQNNQDVYIFWQHDLQSLVKFVTEQ